MDWKTYIQYFKNKSTSTQQKLNSFVYSNFPFYKLPINKPTIITKNQKKLSSNVKRKFERQTKKNKQN